MIYTLFQINKPFNHKVSNEKLEIQQNFNILGPKIGIKFDNLNHFPLNNKFDELDFNHILVEFDLTNKDIYLEGNILSGKGDINYTGFVIHGAIHKTRNNT